MAQTFLHAGEHRLLVAHLGIDHPVGMQPRLRQRRGEEIAPGHAPEHLSRCASGDAGSEQGRGGAMHGAVAAARNLMQRAQRQTTAGHLAVHSLDAERQDAARALTTRFDTGDPVAERGKLGF